MKYTKRWRKTLNWVEVIYISTCIIRVAAVNVNLLSKSFSITSEAEYPKAVVKLKVIVSRNWTYWTYVIEAYSELSQIPKMEFYEKIVHGVQLWTVFTKNSILDVLMDCECTSGCIKNYIYLKELPWGICSFKCIKQVLVKNLNLKIQVCWGLWKSPYNKYFSEMK